MLVWSGSQCWTDGLVPVLKAYTLVFLTMVRSYSFFIMLLPIGNINIKPINMIRHIFN